MRNLLSFLKRLWAYLPVLWRDRDWDYAFLLRLMQLKISRMRLGMNDWPSNRKHFKRMRVIELLIERLIADDYCRYEHDQWYNHDRFNDEKIRDIVLHAQHQEDQDWNMIFNLIKRYGRRWWD